MGFDFLIVLKILRKVLRLYRSIVRIISMALLIFILGSGLYFYKCYEAVNISKNVSLSKYPYFHFLYHRAMDLRRITGKPVPAEMNSIQKNNQNSKKHLH